MSQDRSSHIVNGIQSFLDHVSKVESVGEHGFDKEYEMIQEAQIRYHRENVNLMEMGKLENNLKKNRYKDILPYDTHRLVLTVLNDDPTTDYINASLIAGVEGKGDYIASQGPLASTVNDFWRMIWEYKVAIVFMACRIVEMGKMKCKQYWNDVGNSEVFGDITVFTETEDEIMSDCLRRRFKVTKGDEVRHVIQFHYSGWPDHGVPDDPGHIRDMLGMMRQARSDSTVPLLVHCSAGCGRTGAVIAIDYVWTMLEENKFDETFSLFDLVCKMREQRMSLVQTPDQYALVNKVLKSLCEEWMAKLTHTYENVHFNQDVPDFEDGKPEEIAEDHIYEDVWSSSKQPELTSKESTLTPPERSFVEQRHIHKSDEKKPGPHLSEEASDGVDPIYENLTAQKQTAKTQQHPQLLDAGNGKGHITVIQAGPSSPIRKDVIQSPSSSTTRRNEFPRPSSPMTKNNIPSSPTRKNDIPSSPMWKNDIPISPTRRNEIQRPSSPYRWNEIPGTGEKTQTGHGYLTKTVSAGPVYTSTKPHNSSETIVFQKLTKESRSDNSVPPKTETPTTVGRSEGSGGWKKIHELFTQAFPLKHENPPSVANREAFNKTAFRVQKSQGYSNQGMPATYRRGEPRISPHHQTKMVAFPWSQPAQASPHRQASRSHSSGTAVGSKARNFSSSSEGNPRLEYRSPATAVVLERPPVATVPMAYVDPRYKGFVLLNNGKSPLGRENQHQQSRKQQQRKPNETAKYALPDL